MKSKPVKMRGLRRAGWLILAISATHAVCAAASPDFSGVWQVANDIPQLKTVDGGPPPLKPAALKVYEENQAKWRAGDRSFDPTTTMCISPGLPRILYLPYPFAIIQRPRRITYMFQWNYWNRHVTMSDKTQDVPYPLSLGMSNAYWDHDTLVINTVGLRADNTLLDQQGMPHSEALHVVERLRLLNGGRQFEDRIHIEDPDTFTQPWDTVVRFKRLPKGTEIKEDVCLDDRDTAQQH